MEVNWRAVGHVADKAYGVVAGLIGGLILLVIVFTHVGLTVWLLVGLLLLGSAREAWNRGKR